MLTTTLIPLFVFMLIFHKCNGTHIFVYTNKRLRESAYGNLVLMGTTYNWETCCGACKDAASGYATVTLSNVGECYCSTSTKRVGNASRMMAAMDSWANPTWNGHWGAWVATHDCWPPCGQGSYTRTRSCSFPNNINGAPGCSGASSDTTYCFNRCTSYVDVYPNVASRQLKPNVPVNMTISVPFVLTTISSRYSIWFLQSSSTSDGRSAFAMTSNGAVLAESNVYTSTAHSSIGYKGPVRKDGIMNVRAWSKLNLYATGGTTDRNYSIGVQMKLTDAPGLNGGEKAYNKLYFDMAGDYFHIEMQYFTKYNLASDFGVVNMAISSPEGQYPPGSLQKMSLSLTTPSSVIQESTDISVRIHLPETMTLLNYTYGNVSYLGSVDASDVVTVTTDVNKHMIIFHLDYYDPTAQELSFVAVWRVASKEFWLQQYPKKRADMNVKVHLVYCPYHTCNSGYHYVSSASMKIVFNVSSPLFPLHEQFRLKHTAGGTCLSNPADLSYLKTTSTCKTKFMFTDYAQLREVGASGTTYGITPYMELSETLYQRSTSNDGVPQVYLVPFTSHVCLYNSDVYGVGRAIKIMDERLKETTKDGYMQEETSNGCHLSKCRLKVLKVWNDFSQVVLRSLIKIPSAIVVCNPNGDLGNKNNCFSTKDLGATWVALTASVTFFTFYKPSSNALYGYCHRQTTPCKMVFTSYGWIPIMVSSTEYNDESIKVEAEFAESFDGMDFTDAVVVTQSDPLIGANVFGLHSRTSESASWTAILLWAE